MILQALVRYYELMDMEGRQREAGAGRMPPLWFAQAKVSYGLCLSEEGELTGVMPLKVEVQSGKKTIEAPQIMELPMPYVRGVNILANFLCDNAMFLLGYDSKNDPTRTAECFMASKALHEEILHDIETPAAKAICAYYANWKPGALHPALSAPALKEDMQSGKYFIFIAPDGTYAHECPAIRTAWERYRNEHLSPVHMQCLVTGKINSPIAILHAKIKGVRDAQSAGANLVSFNAPAYESYERKSSVNAPVSEYAAFAYATALNYLLSDSNHRQVLGDTTIVYWAESSNKTYANIFSACFAPREDQNALLHGTMEKLTRGLPVAAEQLDPDTPFYVLGLAPNAARIAVRFFLRDTFGNMLSNVKAHYERLEIARADYEREYLTPYWLLKETVHPKSKDDAASPLLAGAVLRAMLANTNYPEALMQSILLRIHAEHDVNRGKAAILKAYLLKNHGDDPDCKEVATVSLNETSKNKAYVLGRLFAVLEFIQKDANPNIGATIKKRYFSAACDTPGPIFPQLTKHYHIYLDKTRRRVFYGKLVGELMDKLEDGPDTFPARLPLLEQNRFVLGYHHQVQAFYSRSETANTEQNDAQSTEREDA